MKIILFPIAILTGSLAPGSDSGCERYCKGSGKRNRGVTLVARKPGRSLK
jgi:hypothetical protein